MKTNYKINYISQTASHYTTFPQTEQSAKILAQNNNTLKAIANRTQSTISSGAVEKSRNSLLGSNINIFS